MNSVIKITADGEVTTIADAAQGVIGSTCLAWKTGRERSLLVSTNGGMSGDDPSKIVTAKIVEIKIK